jgi:hypothetical protein
VRSAAGCQIQSGSRLPQSKEEIIALRGLSFYRGDKKKRATLPSSSLWGFSSPLSWHSVFSDGQKNGWQKNEMI